MVRDSHRILRHSRQLVSCSSNGLLAAQIYPLALYGTGQHHLRGEGNVTDSKVTRCVFPIHTIICPIFVIFNIHVGLMHERRLDVNFYATATSDLMQSFPMVCC